MLPAARLPSLAALALLATLGCGPREDRGALRRRSLAPKSEAGWVRLPLEPAALTGGGDPWIGDEAGGSVPFHRERSGLWGARQLDVEKLLLGQDPDGRPTAEFSLRIPPTWSIRDREHLRIDLDLQGKAPWVCRVEVARRLEGAAFLGLPRESPLQLQNLDGKEALAGFAVPWDAKDYRVVLQPVSGAAPGIRSLKITAVTDPAALEPEKVLIPAELRCEIAAPAPERWQLRLGSVERVVGLDVHLKGSVAPFRPVVVLPAPEQEEAGQPQTLRCRDLVWNLPNKAGKGSRIAFDPLLTDRLILALPAGARLENVRVLARSEELLFPVLAGQRYWLHLGGQAKPAGNPGALPPSRFIYARDPMRIGPPEPDPQGLPKMLPAPRRTWLRWAALGAAALLVGAVIALLSRSRES